MIGVVSEMHVADVSQAADEQSGADEQHDRQRRLRDEKRRAQARAMTRVLRALPI